MKNDGQYCAMEEGIDSADRKSGRARVGPPGFENHHPCLDHAFFTLDSAREYSAAFEAIERAGQ